MNEQDPEVEHSVKLTAAELALIDQGISELERGAGMTFEQAREHARKRSEQWAATSQRRAAV